jgi:hypothetical protein
MEHIFMLEVDHGGRCAAQQADLPADKFLSKLLSSFMKITCFI